MKILAVCYRSLGATSLFIDGIGFVLEQNRIGEVSCRIGAWITEHEETAAKLIAEYGGKMFQSEALAIFPQHAELIISNWKQ